MTVEPEGLTRLTWDGQLVTAPPGTTQCARTINGRPHPADWVHHLFAPDNPGPMVQLLTWCGMRAHRFILESEGRQVDCPECLKRPDAS